jgi:hypothetical protein
MIWLFIQAGFLNCIFYLQENVSEHIQMIKSFLIKFQIINTNNL